MNEDIDNANKIKEEIISNQLPLMQNTVLPFLKIDQKKQVSEYPIIISGLDDHINRGINFYMNGYEVYKKMDTLARFFINLSEEEWYTICFYNNDRNDNKNNDDDNLQPSDFPDFPDFPENEETESLIANVEDIENSAYNYDNNIENENNENQLISYIPYHNFENYIYNDDIYETQIKQLNKNNYFNIISNKGNINNIQLHKFKYSNDEISDIFENNDLETHDFEKRDIFGKVEKSNCNFLNDYRIR